MRKRQKKQLPMVLHRTMALLVAAAVFGVVLFVTFADVSGR